MPPHQRSTGFTRTELTVVLALLGGLLWLLVPVLGRAGLSSTSQVCMDNLRRLTGAWLMYSDDHNQALVGNYQGGIAQAPTAGLGSWAMGWLDWTGSPQNTNTALVVAPRYGALSRYLEADATLFRCPQDQYVSPVQAARGWLARARSYSMNCYVGNGNQESGPIDSGFVIHRKLTDFRRLSPQSAFVFTEEHPDSINDPMLYVSMVSARWIDLPGSIHEGAAGFGFGDGHVELRRWQSPTTVQPVTYSLFATPVISATDPDLAWIRARSTERSY
jgi:prepilin-type processing-associated H-X9-DG protein